MPSCILLIPFELKRFYYFKRSLCARYSGGYSRCATQKPVTGQSFEGRCPVENSKKSGHFSQRRLGGLYWRRILQIEWQTCEGGQMGKTRDYLFLYFVPPHFLPLSFLWPGNRSQCVTLTDVSIPKTHPEDAGGGETCWSGCERCVCARQLCGTHKSTHEGSTLFSVMSDEQI